MAKPGQWRWYHHVIIVVAMFAFGALWAYLRPSDRVATITLVICAVVFVASFTAVQIRRRRHRRV